MNLKTLLKRSLIFVLILLLSFTWLKQDNRDFEIKPYPRLSDTMRITTDLSKITNTSRSRNYKNVDILDDVANYIKMEFLKETPSVEEQKFDVKESEYKNIIASFGPKDAERIIVGAHYDVCGDYQGADDNASGVAGLLELARLLKNQTLKFRVDLVAYTLEEPPYFRTEYMGSYVHAKYLHDNKIPVKGMISLEMIGYYSDTEGSQNYPLGFLKWIYGTKGNFITIVEKLRAGSFAKSFRENMLKEQTIRTKKFKAPSALAGIDFSDHLNYWNFDYSAVMITNTAFYRNKNYHKKQDVVEKLNIGNIGLVVDGVFRALLKL
jgi:Zn-dependent M28 family amino/carboxypeptidase